MKFDQPNIESDLEPNWPLSICPALPERSLCGEVTEKCLQVAFIEELQRRLTPMNGKPLRLPGSKSSPNFVHIENNGDGGQSHETMEDLRAEPRSPFELRALEVALDVVRLLCPCLCENVACYAMILIIPSVNWQYS